MPDSYEAQYSICLNEWSDDANEDLDQDNFTNLQELKAGINSGDSQDFPSSVNIY